MSGKRWLECQRVPNYSPSTAKPTRPAARSRGFSPASGTCLHALGPARTLPASRCPGKHTPARLLCRNLHRQGLRGASCTAPMQPEVKTWPEEMMPDLLALFREECGRRRETWRAWKPRGADQPCSLPAARRIRPECRALLHTDHLQSVPPHCRKPSERPAPLRTAGFGPVKPHQHCSGSSNLAPKESKGLK